MKKDYITNPTLFGKPEIIGFGSSDFYVKEMTRKKANEIIEANHYSKKTFNNSYIHLGIYINNELIGVLQYGHLMNNNSVGSLVEGTINGQAIELNRMWLDDKAPRNSESMALSYSIKYLRGKRPDIKWIQSFADERCGGFGIVYQAANFDFYGEHTSEFYEYNGETFHKIMFTNRGKSASNSTKAKMLRANKDKAKKTTLRQFRYIFFIDKRWKKKCLLKEKPYLKHYNGD